MDERAGDVVERLGDRSFAVVVGERDVVLGKLLARVARDRPDARVAQVLVEGPTSVRASEDPQALLERMRQADTRSVLVTTGEGRLLGVFVRDDGEAALDEDGRRE